MNRRRQQIAGLHYNWHRHYDASLGRYTQPDPLGFVDGPSVHGYARSTPYLFVDPNGQQSTAITKIIPGLCTLGMIEPTPLGEIACACAIAAAAVMAQSKPDPCQQNSCMAKPPGYWNVPEGAREWGRRNNVPPKEAQRKFHEIKQSDPGSRGDDDYYVDPETGEVIGPSGESAGNLGD